MHCNQEGEMPARDEEHERTQRLIEHLMATQEPAPIGARARECVGGAIARTMLKPRRSQ